ncbi:MAG: 50S ribosomal protein L24, partial [Ilumatobacteraceae bacterium]
RANEQSGLIDKDMPVDVSNVMYLHKGKGVRLGYTTNSKGEKVRVARPSGDEV